MKIYRDVQLLDTIIEQIKKNWGDGSRSGIHASDLLSPRKSYFQKTSPLPPSMKEIMYFFITGHFYWSIAENRSRDLEIKFG